jgi:cyanophycinase
MMRPAKQSKGATRGFFIPIGGAENRVKDPVILQRFVTLCGGPRAHIAVIPTASSRGDTGDRYESVFRNLGADRVSILPFKTRADCESERYLKELDRADGVFMTGGDQVRLAGILSGTSAAELLRTRNAEGMHIAGTSAGASAMSADMIAGGKSGSTPRAGMVDLAPGLGLLSRLIIDQHFSQRDRLGRLLTAVATTPFGVGIGLDEDTAAFIGPDDTLEVVGSGGVTIIDGSNRRNSTGESLRRDDAVGLTGIRLHILVAGNTYDLNTHTLLSGTPPPRNSTRDTNVLTRSVERLLKAAKLKNLQACIEGIAYRHNDGHHARVVAALAESDRIRNAHLRLTGATGIGKIRTACAFMLDACRRRFSALHAHTARLLEALRSGARGDGSFSRRLARLASRVRHFFM